MSFQSAIPWQGALQPEPASASPTGNDSQQPMLPYNDFSANGNNPLNSVSQPKGALHFNPSPAGRSRRGGSGGRRAMRGGPTSGGGWERYAVQRPRRWLSRAACGAATRSGGVQGRGAMGGERSFSNFGPR